MRKSELPAVMDPSELERLVALGDAPGIVEAAAHLSPQQRRALSKTAQSLKRSIDRSPWELVDNTYQQRPVERLVELLGTRTVDFADQQWAADLAVLAVGPLAAAKKVDSALRRYRDRGEDLVVKVLSDRRPDWLDDWVAALVAPDFSPLNWETLWPLIKGGICQKPTSDDYYRWMASNLYHWYQAHRDDGPTLTEILASEPILLNDIWKLFEVESDAFLDSWYIAGEMNYELWPAAIRNLARQGLLDRDRLLDASLAGQTTGLKLNVISGFARFHERLEPSAAELTARQSAYSDLLSFHEPRVVSFAVKMIKLLDQSKCLDDDSFVTAARPVFNVRTKGPPKTVLGLLKKMIRRRPDLVGQVVPTLVDALSHPAEDVQATALDLLATLTDHFDATATARIADQLEELAASNRTRAAELITLDAAGTSGAAAPESTEDESSRLAECQRRANAVDLFWRKAAGVDHALSALADGGWAPRLEFDPMQVPILSGVARIEPISSLEELIDAVAHAIEQVDGGGEVERILDGISRFCDQKPDDFDRRVAPLIKRAQATRESDTSRGIANQRGAPWELVRVVDTWMTGRANLMQPAWAPDARAGNIANFINVRLEALRERVASAKAAPLLATPTHERGWIDARVMVERWHDLERAGSHPPKFEIIQALLRMAPDGRSDALDHATALKHRWARPLRWALGSDDGPTRRDQPDASLWLAAGRARSPRGNLEELIPLGLEDAGPDAVHPGIFQWDTTYHHDSAMEQGIYYPHERLNIHTLPELDVASLQHLDRPTVLLHAPSGPYAAFQTGFSWAYDWIATVWPANLDSFFAKGALCLVSRLGDQSSTWAPNHAFFNPLFDLDRPWSNMAHLIAVLGIAGRDQDVRGLAIDALVQAIDDGRLDPVTLGQTMATLSAPSWLKLNRISENLAEVARVPPLHAWTVAVALHQLLSAYKKLPSDLHHVLALLNELHALLGLQLPETAAVPLRAVKGASKTAKLSKSLLSAEAQVPNDSCNQARFMTLEIRLERAERWAGSQRGEAR